MREKEEKRIQNFVREALDYFAKIFEAGVEMDLVKVGGKPGSFDEDRFRIHVAPSKATTGLLCSNLLSELLAWAEKKSGAKERGSGFMAYYSVMVYTETPALCCELLRQGVRVRCGPESLESG